MFTWMLGVLSDSLSGKDLDYVPNLFGDGDWNLFG